MLGHRFADSAAPIRKVKEVQFGILSPEEIVSATASYRVLQTDLFPRYRKPTLSLRLNTLK